MRMSCCIVAIVAFSAAPMAFGDDVELQKKFDAQKREIDAFERQEKYGIAVKMWGDYMKELQRDGLGQSKKRQELYYDAYYFNSLCYFKLSQKTESVKGGKSDLYLQTAVNMIVRLENSKNNIGWTLVGPRYQKYMTTESTLKAAYDAAKKTLK